MAKTLNTIEEVQAVVREIRRLADDYERAHAAEDDLYEGVLRAVAEFTLRPGAVGGVIAVQHLNDLAKAALKSKSIKFMRVCA